MSGTVFDPQSLLVALQPWRKAPVCWVAYSGGPDSHVLLHALAGLRDKLPMPLRAVHVDHGLQPTAATWAAHCQAVCDDLAVPLTQEEVTVSPPQGASLEAAARDARYEVFRRCLEGGGLMLTAHHRDDQIETVLQRLFRGSGPKGLAGMAAARPLGAGSVLRPLLEVPREQLEAYAREHRLDWVEDPSNADRRHDRNYLRHEILPRVRQRWRGVDSAIERSARHCREAANDLDELARADLASIAEGEWLRVDALSELDAGRRAHAVRLWLSDRGLRPPNEARLRAGLDGLVSAEQDRRPELAWPEGLVRRYQGKLFAAPPPGDRPALQPTVWDLRAPLSVPGSGILWGDPGDGGFDASVVARGVEVRFRQGGERCIPQGSGHHRLVKRLLQEAGVPPWQRGVIPLLYVDGQLAAIPGVCICEGFQARGKGLVPRWRER